MVHHVIQICHFMLALVFLKFIVLYDFMFFHVYYTLKFDTLIYVSLPFKSNFFSKVN